MHASVPDCRTVEGQVEGRLDDSYEQWEVLEEAGGRVDQRGES